MKRREGSKFGHDGITAMVNRDRAIRAREANDPSSQDRQEAEKILDILLARAQGRRH